MYDTNVRPKNSHLSEFYTCSGNINQCFFLRLPFALPSRLLSAVILLPLHTLPEQSNRSMREGEIVFTTYSARGQVGTVYVDKFDLSVGGWDDIILC